MYDVEKADKDLGRGHFAEEAVDQRLREGCAGHLERHRPCCAVMMMQQ